MYPAWLLFVALESALGANPAAVTTCEKGSPKSILEQTEHSRFIFEKEFKLPDLTGKNVVRIPVDPKSLRFRDRTTGVFTKLNQVTIVRDPKNLFLVDFYLHGPDGTEGFQMKGLDMRQFLHRNIEIPAGAPETVECLKYLNAFFGEFNRKARFFALPEDLKSRFQAFKKGCGERPRTLEKSQEDELTRLDQWRKRQEEIANAYDDLDDDGSTRSTPKGGPAKVTVPSAVHLTNNCREPGNYEFKIVGIHGVSKKPTSIVAGHFQLPLEYYDEILKAYTGGIGIGESGAGIRITNHYAQAQAAFHQMQGEVLSAQQEGSAFHQLLDGQFYNDVHKGSEACRVDALSALGLPGGKPEQTGSVSSDRGEIDWSSFDEETHRKGISGRDILSYVRTPCDKPKSAKNPKCPPRRFHPPEDYKAPSSSSAALSAVSKACSISSSDPGLAYWTLEKCKVVEHRFQSYADIQDYDVSVSSFEIDGRYYGRPRNGGGPDNENGGRWPVDYGYTRGLKNFEMRTSKDGKKEVRILHENGEPNLIVGNIDLKPGESKHFLLGYGSRALASDYEDRSWEGQKSPPYAYLYGKDGAILNHYDLKQGIGKVYVRRDANGELSVELVSHERIAPVWRGKLN